MRPGPELLAFLAGLLMFAVGLALVWPPLGLIGPGAVLMAASVFGPSKRSEP